MWVFRCLLGGVQKPSGHGPGQPGRGGPAGAGAGPCHLQRPLLFPQQFRVSVQGLGAKDAVSSRPVSLTGKEPDGELWQQAGKAGSFLSKQEVLPGSWFPAACRFHLLFSSISVFYFRKCNLSCRATEQMHLWQRLPPYAFCCYFEL